MSLYLHRKQNYDIESTKYCNKNTKHPSAISEARIIVLYLYIKKYIDIDPGNKTQ